MKTIELAKLSESEWLRARHAYLGSSDLPTLLGAGYSGSTYWSVYHEKKQPEPDLDDDASISSRLWWGRQMQKIIGAAIVREHGWTMTEGSTLVVDEERRISATIDFDVVHPERGAGSSRPRPATGSFGGITTPTTRLAFMTKSNSLINCFCIPNTLGE